MLYSSNAKNEKSPSELTSIVMCGALIAPIKSIPLKQNSLSLKIAKVFFVRIGTYNSFMPTCPPLALHNNIQVQRSEAPQFVSKRQDIKYL